MCAAIPLPIGGRVAGSLVEGFVMRFAAAAFLALMLGASPALAGDQDAPMPTAGASGSPPMDTATQIERYLADAAGEGERPLIGDPDDRKIHGEVSVSVGTGGYRSGYIAAQMPVGEAGSLALSYGRTDFGKTGGGYLYGDPTSPCLRGPDGFAAPQSLGWSDRARVSRYGCPFD